MKKIHYLFVLIALSSCGEKYISLDEIDKVKLEKNHNYSLKNSNELVSGTVVDYNPSTLRVHKFYNVENGKIIGDVEFDM